MSRRPSGFTLIELMVAVAIIGILSSVAIPTFRSVQLRSRQTERTVLLQAIHASIEDYFARDNHFPQWDPAAPNTSSLWLSNNPGVWTFSGQKNRWRHVSWGDHWQDLGFRVEGDLYYVYWGTGTHTDATRQYWLIAQADLDGDGVVNQLQRYYWFEGPNLQRVAGISPVGNWSFQWEIPAMNAF